MRLRKLNLTQAWLVATIIEFALWVGAAEPIWRLYQYRISLADFSSVYAFVLFAVFLTSYTIPIIISCIGKEVWE